MVFERNIMHHPNWSNWVVQAQAADPRIEGSSNILTPNKMSCKKLQWTVRVYTVLQLQSKFKSLANLVVSTHSGPPYFLVGLEIGWMAWIRRKNGSLWVEFCCFETRSQLNSLSSSCWLPRTFWSPEKRHQEILKSQNPPKSGRAKTWHRHLQEFMLKRFKNVLLL